MKVPRILITGGSGFLGTAVTSALLRSSRSVVAILDPRAPVSLAGEFASRIEYIKGDIEQFASAVDRNHRFDAVAHLAWTTHPATSQQDVEYDAKSNICPSIRLLQHCAAMGVSRFVFSSSGGTVYGRTSSELLNESHPTDPISAYGISKLAVEKYADLIGRASGFSSISLRVSNPIGQYQLHGHPIGSIATFLLAVHQNKPITVYGDGSVVRDYISIDDVAEAFRIALTMPDIAAGAYNIGSGVGRSLNEVITMIQECTGKRVLINRLPPRPFDVPKVVLDSSRFRALTPWQVRKELDKEVIAMWQSLVSKKR